MKKRHIVFSTGAVAVVAVWMLRPASPVSSEIASADASKTATDSSASIPPAAESPVLKPTATPQVVAPKVAPAPKPAQQDAVDYQKDLGTALAELVRLGQAGDLVTAWQTYARPDYFTQIPADRRTTVDDELRAITTRPQGQMRVQIMMQALDALTTQAPVYNQTNDGATYQVSGPAAAVGLKELHFEKVDGRWYIANNDLDSIGQLLGL